MINFPINPLLNQIYTYGIRSWKFDGISWVSTGYIPQPSEIVIQPALFDGNLFDGNGTQENPYTLRKYNIGKSYGAIGHSIWRWDGLEYSGVLQIDIQTNLRNNIEFTNYANYGYSGLGITVVGGSHSLLPNATSWLAMDIYSYDSITNDFYWGAPLGTQNDFINRTGNTTYYGALRELHESLKAKNNGYRMICANALKRNNASLTSWNQNSAGHTLEDYSEALKSIAKRLGWLFIDQFQDSGINDDNLNIYTRDGLHPNNDGYERYWRLWYQKFLEI